MVGGKRKKIIKRKNLENMIKEKLSKKNWFIITLFCFMVCISVAFVKQHSVVDIFAALPVCVLAEWIAFHKTNCYNIDRKNRV